MMVSFVLSFFPRDVLDEILNLIGSVSEGFPSYSVADRNILLVLWYFGFNRSMRNVTRKNDSSACLRFLAMSFTLFLACIFVVVSNWRKYVQEVLVNHLGGLSPPRKSVIMLTDRPDITSDVYRGRKTTIQQLYLCYHLK